VLLARRFVSTRPCPNCWYWLAQKIRGSPSLAGGVQRFTGYNVMICGGE